MCRNITILRGLQPPATEAEIRAAAEQYVRKVSGIGRPSTATGAAFETAVSRIADATAELLDGLPPRRQVPASEPPMRRHGRP